MGHNQLLLYEALVKGAMVRPPLRQIKAIVYEGQGNFPSLCCMMPARNLYDDIRGKQVIKAGTKQIMLTDYVVVGLSFFVI